MSLNDTLELDTIIKKSNIASNPIGDVKYEGDDSTVHNSKEIQTNTYVFEPQKPGNYIIPVNGQQLSVEVTDPSTIPESGISQEEDGEISEYSGDTSFFSTTSSPTVNGSDYAISHSNNQNKQYIEATFQSIQYDKFSMFVYPENVNNEVMFVDSSNGNVVFGIYFRSDGIYYSGSQYDNFGTISNGGSTSRSNGTELVSNSNILAQYYHIELVNINWQNEELDIRVDGSIVASNEPFILTGLPDIIHLQSNSGYKMPNTGGYVDKIDIGN